ncbi:AT-rich interactive domain-containing protein 4B isoform X1 [Astyanax mexicanus]|uniref:AT-rich interactive domain-containing protein 4B isoform X1 n=1 Tax=Astyanax mexicanus TaxID=7994 RepID=UPI0020CB57B9|nr:AT-rich interactive domain-containing protein 4B isoform X1 [Astyanax mexicanus]
MKTLEEPPYLTVGTDVSAKYRGAFCEAKIKTAKRLVKAKVTFKPDSSTAEVHDEHIRGTLKVGAVVEVKNQDGVYQEATINKLTDASLYTVVFDDGDEKTLRRSSLCLKGARHFAESETLDRLPLTNPEHFGTPVIGKKGNRGGRRSNPIQEEESSSSSSEEEGDQQQNEELYGKVVCVEAIAAGDKKKSWYPALVISPDCHEDVTMKKDNVFVRSFKDGKFHTVLRKDVQELEAEVTPKVDASLKPALEAAWEFQKNGSVPSIWRTEVKDESSSSEEEDEEDEEVQEDDGSSEEEEEEVEPFPEERENFLQQLYKFMEDRGTPINKRPVLGYRNLNLFKLYRLVHKLGGFDNIESGSVWKQVYQDLGIPILNSAAGYNVKCAYRKYLYGFEDYCTSTGITFRMDLPLKVEKPSPPAESAVDGVGGASSSADVSALAGPSDEPKPEQEPEISHSQSNVKEDKSEVAGPGRTKVDTSSLKEADKGSSEEEENGPDEEPEKHDSTEVGPTPEGPCSENVKEEPCEEQNKEESGDDSSQEWEEGEEFECYPPGMKVQVRYGRGRNQKTYEATVKESDLEGGEVLYLVHYCGWNIRYDEWIKADKIVRPANKNVPKIKHRKKIKNKAEREREQIERLNERDDLSPAKHRISRSSKLSSSNEVCPKTEECDDKEEQQTLVKSPETASDVNGLRASESSSDDSEREEDDDGDHDGEGPGGRPGLRRGGPPERPRTPPHWEGGTSAEGFKASVSVSNAELPTSQDVPETGKRKGPFENESEVPSTRRRKPEGPAERTPKTPCKGKTRGSRGTDWLPSSSPKKLDERNAGPVDDPGDQSSSSSEDECGPQTNTQAVEEPRIHPKTKGSPSKKYNGLKEKTKGGRSSGFWEIPEKRAKIAVGIEERAPGCRAKGQKDVWSSIQAQWPKKTLKELFSDSDTEAANSPPPAVQALDEPRSEPDQKEEPAKEPQESQPEKSQEYPSSGSNSVLNTPPTTPESAEALPETRLSSTPPQSSALASCSPAESEDTAGPLMEECAGGRSESDSSMVEVESVGCEIQDLPREEEAAPSPSKAFDGNLSSNSNCSLTLSSSSQQDSEQKAKASSSNQKRHKESQGGGASKKHKRSHKTLSLHPKKNHKSANSSDSEDQCISEGTAKSPTSKSSTSDLKPIVPPKCSGRTPPSHKYHKHSDSDHSQPKEPHGNGRGSRIYKWSFQMSDLEKMSSLERIAFLQEKLQDIRNHYLSLKSEVASIDRRRKRMKKKERETGAAVASSSSSSSPSSSSLTAAVMLTLADPTVSGSSQNSGVSVECR